MAPRAHQVGKNIPNYPGRKTAEAVVGPVVHPAALRYAGHALQRLMGFWALWHAVGGFEGIRATGFISRASLYKHVAEFEEVFGVSVEDWQPVLAGGFRASTVKAELLGSETVDASKGEQLRLAE